ncbi:MAG: hypothetical protein FK734_02190 [Asgard group archaeon]|nr:hypothetical protein [Asgard group archaeon]
MAKNGPRIMELSPYGKERLKSSILAMVGLFIGIVGVCGTLIVQPSSTMVQFTAIFLGSLFIFFSMWRILRISTVKLYIDEEEIRYRDRFVWQKINWTDVISVGRANDIETDTHKGTIKGIKSLLILTKNGLKEFDMTSYSLTHGLETVNKIMESRQNEDEMIEEEYYEI